MLLALAFLCKIQLTSPKLFIERKIVNKRPIKTQCILPEEERKIKVKKDCLWKQGTHKITKIGDSV